MKTAILYTWASVLVLCALTGCQLEVYSKGLSVTDLAASPTPSASASAGATTATTNSAPVASGVSGTVLEDSATGVSVTLAYTDADSDLATSCAVTGVTKGSVGACSCSSGVCTVTFTPTPELNGTATFQYTVTAGGTTSSAGTAAITIQSYCSFYTQTAAAPFVTGYTSTPAGTNASPYLICNQAQMTTIQTTTALWDKVFKLKADINLAGYSGVIGTAATKFTGTFDGNNHTLSNFTYNNNATDNVGIFGYVLGDGTIDGVTDGVIKNLRATSVSVVGKSYVGGLVGTIDTGKIDNCSTTGSVQGGHATSTNTGGLVGRTIGTTAVMTVNNSSSSAAVSGVDVVGGVLGGGSGTLSSITGTGSASASGVHAGGLFGLIDACAVTSSSFSGGAVAATGGYTGGVAGRTSDCNLTDVSSSGSTITVSSNVGGLLGRFGTNPGVTRQCLRCSSSTNITATGGTGVGGLIGSLGDNGGTILITDSFSTGAVNMTSSDYVGGLIGTTALTGSSVISGSYSTGAVNGRQYVGGLVGNMSGATASITGSYTTGAVTGTSNIVGGLIGFNATPISNSYHTTGLISGAGDVGGLIGKMEINSAIAYTISNCYNTANVTSSASQVGGLVGYGDGFWGNLRITNSYATGTVTFTGGAGGGNVAGLVGFYEQMIANSYFSGTVNGGVGDNVGGLCGQHCVTSNSYSTGSVSGRNFVGGAIGLAAGPFTDSYSTAEVSGNGYVGGFAGQGGTLTRVFASGNVKAVQVRAGGLMGALGIGAVTDSYSTGDVYGGTTGQIGGLIGELSNTAGTVTRSFATGSANSAGGAAGGFVGSNSGTISDSFATGAVRGQNGGGFSGGNYGTITGSWSSGSVVATGDNVGGFASLNATGGLITRSYSTGNVNTAGGAAGGFVGNNQGTISFSAATGNTSAVSFRAATFVGYNINGTISYSYGTGSVSGGPPVSGFAGQDTTGTYTAVYWNNSGGNASLGDTDSGNHANIFATSLANLKLKATYTGWDFIGGGDGANDDWSMPLGVDGGLPRPNNASSVWGRYYCYGAALAAAPFAAGAGTKASPYVICNATQFAALAGDTSMWNKFFILGEDINLTATAWTPIGSSTTPFSGTFDGLSRVITNFSYSNAGTSNAGLFGYVSGNGGWNGSGNGEIRNINLSAPAVTGASSTGALAGYVGTGLVMNSYVTAGTVAGTAKVGGAVGEIAANGRILRVSSTTAVTASGDAAGGLVGSNAGSIKLASAKTGAVSAAASTHVGGLVGQNSGSVVDSYAQGAPTGSTMVGGLVGTNSGTINRCFSTGTPTGTVKGGLVASNTGTVSNAFWDVTTTSIGSDGATTGSSGGTGKSTANLQPATLGAAQATFTTFDFDANWAFAASAYPKMCWE